MRERAGRRDPVLLLVLLLQLLSLVPRPVRGMVRRRAKIRSLSLHDVAWLVHVDMGASPSVAVLSTCRSAKACEGGGLVFKKHFLSTAGSAKLETETSRSLLHQLWAFLSTRILSTPIPSTRVDGLGFTRV